MDLIKEAIRKAKSAAPAEPEAAAENAHANGAWIAGKTGWIPPGAELDPKRLEENRVVAFGMHDPTHVAFNLLRTKIYKAMQDNRWRTLAITSPTAGCGKTMVCVNLALSMARQPACRTVLIDLDLKRAGISTTLGVRTGASIGDYLARTVRFEDCFAQVAPNLVVGVNLRPLRESSELVHERRLKEMLQRVNDVLSPDVVVIDLPPMLTTDEAIAVLPNVDSSLLVVGAGQTTAAEVAECERHFAGRGGYLGVVLNKSEVAAIGYGY